MSTKSVLVLLILLFSISNWVKSEDSIPEKQITITKTSSPPKIDGKLDDACWQNCQAVSDLVQYEPENQTPTI